MRVSKKSMVLYLVTDRSWLNGRQLADQVEAVLKAGATFLQLREKALPYDEFVAEGKRLKAVAGRYGVPFVINDDIEIALAVDADGVHMGQSDGSVRAARQKIGQDKILGVSAQTVEQALKAQEEGADYIGVGAVFTTATKGDADSVLLETLKDICEAVSVPVVAIGGIHSGNILQMKGTGVDGAAVISAILGAPDADAATKELLALAREMTGGFDKE